MNTETRFTPGPWWAAPLYNSDIPGNAKVQVCAAPKSSNHSSTLVADAAFDYRGSDYYVDDRSEAEANAHLIAAAPDMYAALKDAREYVMELLSMRNLQSVGYTRHGQIPIIEECLENIDAALAKADGR